MRFVHIADVHLGMGFGSASFGKEKGRERRREIKETLLRTVAYCEENKIDLLLIAGDLFEGEYVSVGSLMDLNEAFASLSHTRVMISAGNHDPILDETSPYRLIQWTDQVHIFDTSMEHTYVEACNTEVWSFSWHKKELPAFDAGGIEPVCDRVNVLMLHGDVYQNSVYMPLKLSQLKGLGMDYIALGHIHKQDMLTDAAAYPGSLEPLDFSEAGDHGFIQGTISEEGCRIDFIPFAKRSFHTLTVPVDGGMTYEGICNTLAARLASQKASDYCRVVLLGDLGQSVSLDIEDMKQRFENQVAYVEIVDNTQIDLDIEALAKSYEGSLIGLYIEAMTGKGLEDPIVADALKKGLRIMLEGQVIS